MLKFLNKDDYLKFRPINQLSKRSIIALASVALYQIKNNIFNFKCIVNTGYTYTGWFTDSGFFEMLITPLIFELSL